MRSVTIMAVLAVVGLSACGPDEDDVAFDGHYYRAKVSTERGARDSFVVSARPVSASLLGAREAARYEATVYCVNRFGRSDILWAVGPDSPDGELPIANDTLTLSGRCPE